MARILVNTPQSGIKRLLGGSVTAMPELLENEQFVVNLKHPKDSDLKPIDELQLDVFYGIQEFDFADSSKPIIVISANYDALGAAPSMQAGIERSISSILSVMHLSRLFGGKSSH